MIDDIKQVMDKMNECILNNDSFIIGVCYISYKDIDNFKLQEIRRNLTFTEVDYHSGETIETTSYYEQQNYLIIPKYYESIYGSLNIDYKYKYVAYGEPIDIECNAAPRNKAQQDMIDEFMQEEHTAIIKANPGFGKTYLGIRISALFNRKTLILIDNTKLGLQWISDFKQFTGLSDEYFNVIEGSNKFNAKNLKAPIIVTTVQTLSSICKTDLLPTNEKFKLMLEANFGLIIIDEIHKSFGSPEFSKAAIMFFTNKVLGLSATPRKTSEASTRILLSYFNNRILQPVYEKKSKIYCQLCHFNSNIAGKTMSWINWGGKFDLNKYQKKLIESPNYLGVVSELTKLLKPKKKIIYIAHTTAILQGLIDHLVKNEIFDSDEIGLAISGATEEDFTKNFIFTTYKMFTAGLSVNHMDTLIYLTPPGASTTAIEQSSGRIDRDHNDALTRKLVIDLIDVGIPSLAKRITSRVNEYQRLNMIIEREFMYQDDKFVLYSNPLLQQSF